MTGLFEEVSKTVSTFRLTFFHFKPSPLTSKFSFQDNPLFSLSISYPFLAPTPPDSLTLTLTCTF